MLTRSLFPHRDTFLCTTLKLGLFYPCSYYSPSTSNPLPPSKFSNSSIPTGLITVKSHSWTNPSLSELIFVNFKCHKKSTPQTKSARSQDIYPNKSKGVSYRQNFHLG
mmetsp:Transcript_2166/g.3222  ORF Transcript_2166/g.3222 Transcript_2166/m.3222 type:complete len:108 (+) Transcript_2166:742-1065(+)